MDEADRKDLAAELGNNSRVPFSTDELAEKGPNELLKLANLAGLQVVNSDLQGYEPKHGLIRGNDE